MGKQDYPQEITEENPTININYATVAWAASSVFVSVCVDCYSCLMMNEVQARVSIGF